MKIATFSKKAAFLEFYLCDADNFEINFGAKGVCFRKILKMACGEADWWLRSEQRRLVIALGRAGKKQSGRL